MTPHLAFEDLSVDTTAGWRYCVCMTTTTATTNHLSDLRLDNTVAVYRLRTTTPEYGLCDEVVRLRHHFSDPMTFREAIREQRRTEGEDFHVDIMFTCTGELIAYVRGAEGDGSLDGQVDELPF